MRYHHDVDALIDINHNHTSQYLAHNNHSMMSILKILSIEHSREANGHYNKRQSNQRDQELGQKMWPTQSTQAIIKQHSHKLKEAMWHARLGHAI